MAFTLACDGGQCPLSVLLLLRDPGGQGHRYVFPFTAWVTHPPLPHGNERPLQLALKGAAETAGPKLEAGWSVEWLGVECVPDTLDVVLHPRSRVYPVRKDNA